MKKIFLILIIVSITFSCTPKKKVDFGFISFYYGDIKIILSGKKTKPKLKMILKSGDKVYTREKARIDIQLHNFGVIRINQNSKVDIKKIITEVNESIKVGLKNGQILCKISKLKKTQDLNVETPTAVVGVRGTTFLVDANKKEKKSEVAVTSGKVDVENKKAPGKKVTVKANQTAKISTKDKALNIIKGIDTKKLKELKVLQKVKIFKNVKSVNIKSLKKMSFKNLKDLNIKDLKGLGKEFQSIIPGKGQSKGPSATQKKIKKTTEKIEKQKQKIEEKKKKLEKQKKDAEKNLKESEKKAKDTLKGLFK